MKIPWEMSRENFVAVICCVLCCFLTTVTIMTVSCAVGYIRDETGATEAAVSSFSRITTVSCVIFFLIAIAITNKFGKKNSMMWGLVIVCVSSLFCAMTKDLKVMTWFRLGCGAGLALINTSCLSILSDNVSEKYLGEAMALYFSISSLGAIFTPFLGPFLAEKMGVWALFVLPAILAILIIIPLRKIDNVRIKQDSKIDLPMNITYLAATTLMFGSMLYPILDDRIVYFIIGVALFVLFVILYAMSDDRTFDVKLFKNKLFTISLALAFVVTFCAMGVENSMSQLFQFTDSDIHAFGITISMVMFAAFLTALKPAIQTLISPMIGKYYRERETKNVIPISMILLLASCIIAMVVTRVNTGEMLLILSASVYVLHAVTTSLFTPLNKKTMMTCVGEDKNVASSFSGVINTLASVTGTIILVNVIGGHSSISAFRDATVVVFAVVVFVSLIGLFIALWRRRVVDVS